MLLLLSESMPVRLELDISGAAGDSTRPDEKSSRTEVVELVWVEFGLLCSTLMNSNILSQSHIKGMINFVNPIPYVAHLVAEL
jgi:hypothetical protein